jgi:RimJ/RimL family protein N-acetyltransferase
MEIKYKLDTPDNFSSEEKNCFLKLLVMQGKVSKPTTEKINSSKYLCTAAYNNEIIGIGAIKQVYLDPFDFADVTEIKPNFQLELGYLFVENSHEGTSFRGLGIGKSITRLLLDQTVTHNIFATTEFKENNPMLHILKGFGFKIIGKPYLGHKTKDIITLMILVRE